VPQVNDRVEITTLELTVIAADERRAKQVQARRLPLEDAG
jgi:Mg2+/Co2+ transporter CorC